MRNWFPNSLDEKKKFYSSSSIIDYKRVWRVQKKSGVNKKNLSCVFGRKISLFIINSHHAPMRVNRRFNINSSVEHFQHWQWNLFLIFICEWSFLNDNFQCHFVICSVCHRFVEILMMLTRAQKVWWWGKQRVGERVVVCFSIYLSFDIRL